LSPEAFGVSAYRVAKGLTSKEVSYILDSDDFNLRRLSAAFLAGGMISDHV
jgi:hypothetical protein